MSEEITKGIQNAPEMECKSLAHEVEVKAPQEGSDNLHIKFYALAFNNVDSWGDIIVPSACDEFLKSEDADRMALCWQHDFQTVIGKITSKGIDDYGMFCEAEILPTSVGKDATILLRGGAIKEFSIGYRAEKYHYERKEGYDNDIRILDQIKIFECSPVTIAANPKAVLTDAKGGLTNNVSSKPNSQMENEIKAFEQKLNASMESQKEMAEAMKAANATIDEQKNQITNLDESIKSQEQTIAELREEIAKKNAPVAFKSAVETFLEENKEAIEKKMMMEGGRFKAEVKTIYDITRALVDPNLSLSLQKDTTISAAPRKKNLFLDLLGVQNRTADKLSWIEGSSQDDVDYVDENAQNSHKGDASIGEVQRAYGKLQTSLIISTEVSDWYPMLLDWAKGEAQKALLAKFNEEVWKGVGADTNATTKKKVYGIKGSSTAFSAIDTVASANVADVIFNACEQIANEGYNADVALVSPSVYFALRHLKDANGNYILDRQTDILCSDNREVKVLKAHELTSDEIEVMDTTCVQPFAGNSFEFEAVRDADYDRWKFFFRLCGQNKIKTADKKGLVYVQSAATAIAAMTPEEDGE